MLLRKFYVVEVVTRITVQDICSNLMIITETAVSYFLLIS